MENSINFSPKKDPRDSLFAKKKKRVETFRVENYQEGKTENDDDDDGTQ